MVRRLINSAQRCLKSISSERVATLIAPIALLFLLLVNEISHEVVLTRIQESINIPSQLSSAIRTYRLNMFFAEAFVTLSFLCMLSFKHAQLLIERAAIDHLEHERDTLEKVVAHRTLKLSELATHLQDAREAERRHLARELHDEMGAMFTTAKLDVARIRSKHKSLPAEVLVRLDHLAETLNFGIALKRQIIEELRPSSLANLGLAATLETYLSELAARSSLNITFRICPPMLSDRGDLTVFRIVQESLNNVIKHAHAQNVVVEVQPYGANILVLIRDDGDGFDPTKTKPNTHGLTGMAHRVEVPGGSFEIQTVPGLGTSVVASFPISMA
jgi:signal transduction histidine kinase